MSFQILTDTDSQFGRVVGSVPTISAKYFFIFLRF